MPEILRFAQDDRVTPWSWVDICALDDLVPNVGVAALAGGRQIALFRVVAGDADPGAVYAIDNRDLKSGANVLSRGIVGDLQGELVVASPIYKQHYSLRSGRCIEHPEHSVVSYPVRVIDGQVQIGLSSSYLRRAAKAPRQKLVVIGGGVAARGVVDELLEIAPDLYDIAVLGAADPVVGVQRFKRVVRTHSGRELPYDRLLLATGAMPVQALTPSFGSPATEIAFTNVQGVDALLEAARDHAAALVVGGGLLAIEAANGLLRQGLRVTIALPGGRLMPGELDAHAAGLLQASLEKRGVRFALLTPDLSPAERGESLIVMAAGIRPNVALASKIGLRCEHGVLVNDTLQTFDPRIYAVGACVQHRNATFGLATPLDQQIRVCASHLAELGHSRYRDAPGSRRLSISGIEACSAGDIVGGDGAEDLVFRDTRRGVYKRLVVKDGRVIGAVLYGDVRDANWYFDLIRNRTDVSAQRDRLLFGPDTG